MSDPNQISDYESTPKTTLDDEHAFPPSRYGNQATYYNDHMRMRGSNLTSYTSPRRGSVLETPLFYGTPAPPQGSQHPNYPAEASRLSPPGPHGAFPVQDLQLPNFFNQQSPNENLMQVHLSSPPGHVTSDINCPDPVYDVQGRISLDSRPEKRLSFGEFASFNHYQVPPGATPTPTATTPYFNSSFPVVPLLQNSTEIAPDNVVHASHNRFPSIGDDELFALQHFDNTAGVYDTPAPPKAVAPRSVQFYRVGPPFYPTKIHQALFCHKNDEMVSPVIFSRIDRGFEQGEAGSWIGYKRNYLTLVASFKFTSWTRERVFNNKFYVLDGVDSKSKLNVKYFALTISVKCNDKSIDVGLVQHTPKRDKGPKEQIPVYPAVPDGELPDHSVVQSASNKKNESRVANRNKMFGFDRRIYYEQKKAESESVSESDLDSQGSFLGNYPVDQISQVALFERIQFTKSLRVETSRAAARYFTLSVDLVGILDVGEGYEKSVVLASVETVPLFVRGRSPSSYPSEKTSGYREAN